jgi:hypothetical protein
MTSYQEKYLKYKAKYLDLVDKHKAKYLDLVDKHKAKYLDLKNQSGGSNQFGGTNQRFNVNDFVSKRVDGKEFIGKINFKIDNDDPKLSCYNVSFGSFATMKSLLTPAQVKTLSLDANNTDETLYSTPLRQTGYNPNYRPGAASAFALPRAASGLPGAAAASGLPGVAAASSSGSAASTYTVADAYKEANEYPPNKIKERIEDLEFFKKNKPLGRTQTLQLEALKRRLDELAIRSSGVESSSAASSGAASSAPFSSSMFQPALPATSSFRSFESSGAASALPGAASALPGAASSRPSADNEPLFWVPNYVTPSAASAMPVSTSSRAAGSAAPALAPTPSALVESEIRRLEGYGYSNLTPPQRLRLAELKKSRTP